MAHTRLKLALLVLLGAAVLCGQIVVPRNVVYVPNEAGTGTALNKLVKLTGAPSTAIIAATSETTGIVGVCIAGCGVAGVATIAVYGEAPCVFSTPTVAGDYVVASSTDAGQCADSGADTPPTTAQNVGRVLSTNGGVGTYKVQMFAKGDWSPPIPGPAGAPGSDGAPGVPGYNPNNLLSGGYVVWRQDYDFTVTAASYYIAGTLYNSPQTNLTLDAPDAQPRFVAIAVDDTGTVVVIKGTASATPEKPTVDPATELDLTFVFVPNGTTQPPNVTSTLMYDEDTGLPAEWTTTRNGAGFNLASNVNPYVGAIDIEATAVGTGNWVNLDSGAAFTLNSASNLVFYLRSKAAWPSNNKRSLQFYFADAAGVRVGSIVSLLSGQFGFESSLTAAYQQIVIPVALFAANSDVRQIRITVAGSGSALGFYLDYVSLQAGIQPPVQPSGMTWRGTWNATATYVANDVVIYNSTPYVCLVSNTNSVPPSVNWSAMATLTRGFGASFDGGGGALAAGKTVFTTVPFACTIVAWNLNACTTFNAAGECTAAGTATVDVWRLATGTAVPDSGDSISGVGAGRPVLAANYNIHSTNLTGWSSTIITKNDVIGINLQAVGATYVNLLVECQQ